MNTDQEPPTDVRSNTASTGRINPRNQKYGPSKDPGDTGSTEPMPNGPSLGGVHVAAIGYVGAICTVASLVGRVRPREIGGGGWI